MNPSEVIQMMERLTDYLHNELGNALGESQYTSQRLIEDGWVVSDPEESN